MVELLSWHRVGQRVACIKVGYVACVESDAPLAFLDVDDVYTIQDVVTIADKVAFGLAERPHGYFYQAGLFRPVSPQIIDQLRRLDAPIDAPETEREIA